MLLEILVDSFEIKRGSSIWLSSEVLKIAMLCQQKNETFDGNKIIDLFQNAVGECGMILIPTFCFDFSNNHYYDYKNPKCMSGALGKIALARTDFVRTQHPMHSFAVWGKDKELLANMNNKHAFGDDSPFAYCKENGVSQIMLGTDFVHSMTFVHYAETVCNVPYRFAKSFSGTYVTKDGIEEQRSYDYAARKLEIQPVECFNRLGDLLLENGITKKIECKGIISYIVDLQGSWDYICDDILNNKCRNIYDFNIDREKVFEGWTVVNRKWRRTGE